MMFIFERIKNIEASSAFVVSIFTCFALIACADLTSEGVNTKGIVANSSFSSSSPDAPTRATTVQTSFVAENSSPAPLSSAELIPVSSASTQATNEMQLAQLRTSRDDAKNAGQTTPIAVSKTTPTQSCGTNDVGGWTTPIPSTRDTKIPLKSLTQPGSRLFYISSISGSDTTGDIYFWDGSQIIDSNGSATDRNNVAYGKDPSNPSASVKAYKRWSFVAPRQSGGDIGSRSTVGSPIVTTRAGYPDWWLFKRGETLDLTQDLLSFEKEVNPSATFVNSSLSVPGGRSASERQIVGAYGDLCLPRPRFIHPQLGFITRNDSPGFFSFKNVAYLSLHFDGHDRVKPESPGGLTLLGQTTSSTNILFEDMWFDAAHVNIGLKNSAQITLRRNLITDVFGAAQGIYYEGTSSAKLSIEESILMRNGFSGGDPKKVWPPSGAQKWDIFNRNLYLNTGPSSTAAAFIDSVSMIGASGDQFRAGMRVERNFFYQGYVTMGASGGVPDTNGPTGSIIDNVLQRFVGTGTDDNRGHPGWGLGLTSGASGVEVTRNIVTGAQHAGVGAAMTLSPLGWFCYSHTFKFATRNNRIYNNVFESGTNSTAVEVQDGITGESPAGCANWVFPGVSGNTVTDNRMISTVATPSAYKPVGGALGKSDNTTYARNSIYINRNDMASKLNLPDLNRTLKTHLIGLGVTVASADGFSEYFSLATQMRRGQWRPEWTSKALNNHIRAGFKLPDLQ
jgi:hypothetical protein